MILKDVQNKKQKWHQKKLFLFKEMWLKEESCAGVVEDAWLRGASRESESPLLTYLDECRASLTSWNNNSFGHVGRKLAALQARLEVLECKRGSVTTMEEIEGTRMEINKLLEVEEVVWH